MRSAKANALSPAHTAYVHGALHLPLYGSFLHAKHVENSFMAYYLCHFDQVSNANAWRNLFLISCFTDRFLRACGYAALSRNDSNIPLHHIPQLSILHYSARLADSIFRAEGAFMLTSTHSGAVRFTPPCDRAFLFHGLGRYFTCRRHISRVEGAFHPMSCTRGAGI